MRRASLPVGPHDPESMFECLASALAASSRKPEARAQGIIHQFAVTAGDRQTDRHAVTVKRIITARRTHFLILNRLAIPSS